MTWYSQRGGNVFIDVDGDTGAIRRVGGPLDRGRSDCPALLTGADQLNVGGLDPTVRERRLAMLDLEDIALKPDLEPAPVVLTCGPMYGGRSR
jgi:hypothetical protein